MEHFIFDRSADKPVFGPGHSRVLIAIFLVIFLFFFQGVSTFIVKSELPAWLVMPVWILSALMPLVWLLTWDKYRFCLVFSSCVILLGDYFSAFISLVVISMTFGNFVNLIVQHRHSKIRYYLLVYFLLSLIYFIAAFLLNFIDNPIIINKASKVTWYSFQFGWLGALGGFSLVYHLMYLPLLIYHFCRNDMGFLRKYSYILSGLINVMALIGIYQFFFTSQAADPDSPFRVSSIMRLSTRYAPFVVISLVLLFNGLLESKTTREKLYWWFSILLNALVLLLTFTRGAILGAAVIYLFMMLGLFNKENMKTFLFFLGGSLAAGLIIALVGAYTDVDFFLRFQGVHLERGFDQRFYYSFLYLESIPYQATSFDRALLNLLFGFGWFSERLFVFPKPDPHNTYLSAFASFGLVGGFLYYLPFLTTLLAGFWKSFTSKNIFMRPRYGLIAGLVFFYLVSGVGHNKFYSPIESAYTWICITLLLAPVLPALTDDKKILTPPDKHRNKNAI